MRRPLDQAFIDSMRERIKVVSIIDQLQGCVDGTIRLSKEQIMSAKTLLAKCMPDLKAVEHSGEVLTRRVDELSDAELADIARGGGERTAQTTPSTH